jgi:hypothetical protein
VDCAATGLDILASAGDTGDTAVRTYTVENTGPVPVVITSLIRLGVKAAGSRSRLYVCRFAHGGYAFGNYDAARVQSMLRIATAITGASNHFLVPALGTNDEVGSGLSYTAMKSAVTSYINLWVAAGLPVRNMMPILPWRWSSYSSGGSVDQGNGGIIEAFKEAGVSKLVQTDAYDFVSQGLAGDGHPNDAGFVVEFNEVVQAFSTGAL